MLVFLVFLSILTIGHDILHTISVIEIYISLLVFLENFSLIEITSDISLIESTESIPLDILVAFVANCIATEIVSLVFCFCFFIL